MAKPPGRRKTPPTPAQIRLRPIVTSNPSDPLDAPWETATADHPLPPERIAVGVVQHRLTGHYHAVLSLYGNDLTTVGVFPDSHGAVTLGTQFAQLFIGWGMRGPETSAAMQDAMHQEAERQAVVPPAAWRLPDDQVQDFLASLAESLQRQRV